MAHADIHDRVIGLGRGFVCLLVQYDQCHDGDKLERVKV